MLLTTHLVLRSIYIMSKIFEELVECFLKCYPYQSSNIAWTIIKKDEFDEFVSRYRDLTTSADLCVFVIAMAKFVSHISSCDRPYVINS